MENRMSSRGVFIFTGIVILALFTATAAQADWEYFNNPPGSWWGLLHEGNARAYGVVASMSGYVVACTEWAPESGPPPWGMDTMATLLDLNEDGTVDFYTPIFDPEHPEHTTAALDVDLVLNLSGVGVEGYVVTGLKWQHHEGPGGHDFYQRDLWLMRASWDGAFEWDVTFGGLGDNFGHSIVADPDYAADTYDYVIGGRQADVTGFYGGWLLRTDEAGVVLLDRDGFDPDYGWLAHEVYCTEPTEDGGYISGTDFGMVKADSLGLFEWRVSEGGMGADSYYDVKQTSDGGYIGVGTRDWDVLLTKVDAAGVLEWNQTYGSSEASDYGNAVIPGIGGGYAVVGNKGSYPGHGHGGTDVWLIKTDDVGEVEWDQVLGDEGDDGGNDLSYSISSDSGYFVAGYAEYEGESHTWVFLAKAVHTPPVAAFTYWPESPVYVSEDVFFDASASTDPDGVIERYYWDFGDGETLERTDADLIAHAYASPGVYTITLTVTDDDDISDSTTQEITVEGMAVQWERTIGGTGSNIGYEIIEAHDGGFIFTGTSSSAPSFAGSYDLWIYKTDEAGRYDWEGRYADWAGDPALNDYGQSIADSGDGGYILTGFVGGGSIDTDLLLLKTDVNGAADWVRKFGGASFDEGYSVARAHGEDGYIVGGMTSAGGFDRDLWLIRTHLDGTEDWQQVYDEPGPDYCHALAPVAGGSYVATGQYGDTGDGDFPVLKTDISGAETWLFRMSDAVPNHNYGHWVAEDDDGDYVVAGGYEGDMVLMKINPVKSLLWRQVYNSGVDTACAFDAAKTPDGGFILAGTITSVPGDEDIYLVKTDSEGNLEWEETMGTGEYYESAQSILAMDDGGYVILANRMPRFGGDFETLLIKIGPYDPVPPFGLVAPEDEVTLSGPPTFEWNPGDYDLFRFFTFFKYGASYQMIDFWLTDTSFAMPAIWWGALAPGYHIWTVLGVNSFTGDYDLAALWAFIKPVEP